MGILSGHDHGFTRAGHFQQARLDLTQLDALATDLHLVVQATEVFQHAVGAVTHQVARAVQTLAITHRTCHEALGGQRRAAVIPTGQTHAAQVQLTGHPRHDRLQGRVQYISVQVGNGAPDGHAVAALLHASPVGDVDGGFGRTIQVVQAGLGQACEHLGLGIERQCLAAAENAPQAVAPVQVRRLQEHL